MAWPAKPVQRGTGGGWTDGLTAAGWSLGRPELHWAPPGAGEACSAHGSGGPCGLAGLLVWRALWSGEPCGGPDCVFDRAGHVWKALSNSRPRRVTRTCGVGRRGAAWGGSMGAWLQPGRARGCSLVTYSRVATWSHKGCSLRRARHGVAAWARGVAARASRVAGWARGVAGWARRVAGWARRIASAHLPAAAVAHVAGEHEAVEGRGDSGEQDHHELDDVCMTRCIAWCIT